MPQQQDSSRRKTDRRLGVSRPFVIPKRFCLMGHTIGVNIIRPEKWPHGDEVVGCWDHHRLAIDIIAGLQDTVSGQVFFHELAHAVATMQAHPLATDEAFIDQQAGLYHQAFTSFSNR
jgi:hypothetical protein